MWNIGLSTCGKTVDEELFRQYAEAGITDMEVSVGYLDLQMDLPSVKRWADAYGIRLWTYHLPFAPFEEIDISALDASLRNTSLEHLTAHIRLAAEIGIKNYVIHPSGEPYVPEEREERLCRAAECLHILADRAAEYGGRILVEDLPRTCLGRDSGEILRLIKADDRLMVCFDTNHLLTEDPAAFVQAVGDRIVSLHVSDYDFLNERHWMPGEGKVDWSTLVASLCAVGYDGPWLYEIEFACPDTILRDRELTCRDFAVNADEVLGGKPITTIARHMDNLGK